MTSVHESHGGVKKSVAGATVLLAVDGAFHGSILFSSLFCPIWILVSVIKSAIQRPGWGLALARLAIPVVTLLVARVNNEFQLTVANKNAERVVAACEKFRVDHGRFPTNLDELVPQYLNSTPFAKYCLGPGGRFFYSAAQPMLAWEVFPPHLRKIYNFETRRWSYLD